MKLNIMQSDRFYIDLKVLSDLFIDVISCCFILVLFTLEICFKFVQMFWDNDFSFAHIVVQIIHIVV